MSRQFDADGNGVYYNWAALNLTPPPAVACGSNCVTTAVVWGLAYLTDIYDTSAQPGIANGKTSLSSFAHHARLRWSTQNQITLNTNISPEWHAHPALRLVGVDVTSATMTGGARQMVRRYDLGYEWNATGTRALLDSVEMEGACGAFTEDSTGALPASTNCPTLPATTMTYTPATYAPATSTGSLEIPTQNPYIQSLSFDYRDVNGDAIDDQVVGWVNVDGTAGEWAYVGASQMNVVMPSVPTPPPAHPLIATLANLVPNAPNAILGDWLSDGQIDTLWMNFGNPATYATSYEVYSLGAPNSTGTTTLTGVGPIAAPVQTTATGAPPPWWRDVDDDGDGFNGGPDFAAGNAMDIDGDGLTDMANGVNQESPVPHPANVIPVESYLSARQADGTIAPFRQLTQAACVNSGGFATPTRIASVDGDFDGDGLSDLVYLDDVNDSSGHRIDASVFMNRGDGRFGVFDPSGDPCYQGASGSLSIPSIVLDSNIPDIDQIVEAKLIALHDVNGDGLEDLVVAASKGIYLSLHYQADPDNLGAFNLPGVGVDFFGPATFFPQTWNLQQSADYSAVSILFADLDGSGVDQPVIVNTKIVPAVGVPTTTIIKGFTDIPGTWGVRSNLLQTISNGVGATTTIRYDSLAHNQAQTSTTPGERTTIPVAAEIVTQVVTTNGLAGFAAETLESDYTYANPVYDPRDRAFVGFQRVGVRSPGDASSPGTLTTTTFATTACTVTPGSGCTPALDYYDRLTRALPAVVEVDALAADNVTPSGPLTTATSEYEFNDTYTGMDGRFSRTVWLAQSDLWLWGSGDAGTSGTFNALVPSTGGSPLATVSALLPSATLSTDLRRASFVDAFGNEEANVDYGQVGVDTEAILTQRQWSTVPSDPTGWNFRAQWQKVGDQGSSGAFTGPVRELDYTYDSEGHTLTVSGPLTGTAALHRAAGGAPNPAQASVNSSSVLLETDGYDAYGNLASIASPNNRCTTVHYDPLFNQLPTTTNVGRAGCDQNPLTTTRVFDRGLGAITSLTLPSGAMSGTDYDAFGRVSKIYQPDETAPFHTATNPAVTFDYTYMDSFSSTEPVRKLFVQQVSGDLGTPASTSKWAFFDGFGRTLIRLQQAEAPHQWVATGAVQTSTNGRAVGLYDAAFFDDPNALDYVVESAPTGVGETTRTYDATGRVTSIHGLDGTLAKQYRYNPANLSVTVLDGEQVAGGLHAGSSTTLYADGHGRTAKTVQTLATLPQSASGDTITTRATYLPTGEITQLTQSNASGLQTTRNATYDSLGRMVVNVEPNTSQVEIPQGVSAWTYAYDDNGDLVGTSDARGCGKNIQYDTVGRVVLEDYSPCTTAQGGYSAPQASGEGIETSYVYDVPQVAAAFPVSYQGSLTASYSRGEHSVVELDARGRTTAIRRQVAVPGAGSAPFAARYAPHWFEKDYTAYDEANRVEQETTGADIAELLQNQGLSSVHTYYSPRGAVSQVTSSYGDLLYSEVDNANGSPAQRVYGDTAHTTEDYQYWGSGLLKSAHLYRHDGPWGESPPLGPTDPNTFEGDLANVAYTYDKTGNVSTIADTSSAAWPLGIRPSTQSMTYDDGYRLTRWSQNISDAFKFPPYKAEEAQGSNQFPPMLLPANRVRVQQYQYDWRGNPIVSTDDASAFPDRSLGTITNGGALTTGIDRLTSATENGLTLSTQYDAAGNLTQITIGAETGTDPRAVNYVYQWDEVGKLAEASRYDTAVNATTVAAKIDYAYDGGGGRVLRSRFDSQTNSELHTVTVFDSLRLEDAQYPDANGDFERDGTTEVALLGTNGMRFGRVQQVQNASVPPGVQGAVHLFFELGDHLGSTSFVIDSYTSEVVERATYQAYGAAESDFRSARWNNFRDGTRYTSHDDDGEVGLTYAGARYYSPMLMRWISPDPLTIHAMSGAANPYQYVYGSPTNMTDPTGLDGEGGTSSWGDPIAGALSLLSLVGYLGSLGGGGGGAPGDGHGRHYGTETAPPPPPPHIVNVTMAQNAEATIATSPAAGPAGYMIPNNSIQRWFSGKPELDVAAFFVAVEVGIVTGGTATSLAGGLSTAAGGLSMTASTYKLSMDVVTPGVTNGTLAMDATMVVLPSALGKIAPLAREGLGLLQGGGAAEGLEGGGMAAIRQLGTDGEDAANILKNTEHIPSASGTAAYRIPDVLDHGAQVIGDVKNVGRLSYTSQLRDYASYAQQNGYQFQLWVRPTTQLSGPLAAQVANGNIILNFLP